MVPEARSETTEHGLAPTGEGWFVANARELRWRRRLGRGWGVSFTGWSRDDVAFFPQLGIGIVVLQPGEPSTLYHWEQDQEDFLVLQGEAIAILEGEERRLRQWDFVHCPPGTKHAFVAAGGGPCVLLAVGARDHAGEPCHGGGYVVDAVAAKHGAAVEQETTDPHEAYARFAPGEPSAYEDGLLPDL